MTLRYPRNPSTQSAWRNKKAAAVKELLPASRAELMRILGLSKNTIDAAISTLRQTETVYTVQAGSKTIYELRQQCGHSLFDIVHTDEGTAFCGSCADDSLRENINKGNEA